MPLSLLTSPLYLQHDEPTHPESASRLRAIHAMLENSGLRERCLNLEPRPATVEQITAVHTEEYVAAMERVMARAPGYLDPDTYIVPQSYETAVLAAGGAIRAVDAVLDESAPPLPARGGERGPGGEGGHAAFALVRPPGHHATPDAAMGFCLFNNIAIAARHAQSRGMGRILIVDFDVHHGNGTQDAFYADPSVLYISSHQWGIYPGTGRAEETGIGDGRGFNINIPLPAGAGDSAFDHIADEIIAPAAARFAPDMLLVSAGFDAHWADPLASLQLSTTGYFRLAQKLVALAEQFCGGRIMCTLEGGYNTDALAASVRAVCHALLKDPSAPDPLGPAPRAEPDVRSTLQRVMSIHSL
jgi:acetoin utilization deacetylase AcuC-like enzyme